jgi:DNA topoisomerase VI subunit B
MPYDSSETNMFIVYTKNFSKLKKTPLDPRIDAVVKLKQALDTILPSGAPTVRLQTFKTYLSGLPKNQPDMSKLLDLENQFSREMIVQDAQEYFDKQRLMILSPEIDPEIYQGFRGDFDSFFWDIIRSNVPKKERVIEFGSSLYILRGVRQADGKVSLSISLVDISVFDRVKIPVPKTSILLPIVAEAIKKGLSSLYQTTYYTKYLWCAQDENGIYKFQVC